MDIRRRALLLPLFGLSGCAALLHETVFLRIVSFRIESVAVAVGSVVGWVMLGLALGSWWSVRWRRGHFSAFLAFLLFEGLIGLLGGTSPWLGGMLEPVFGGLYRLTAGTGVLYQLLRTVLVGIIIFPSAFFMGATFPLVVRSAEAPARWVGWLYGVNAFGGALGAIAGAFWLVPRFGYKGAALFGAAINALIVIAGLLVRTKYRDARATETVQNVRRRDPQGAKLAMSPLLLYSLLLAVTGFCGMVWEVAWTRALSLSLGPTPYAFGVILASYVLGLSFGAILGSRLGKTGIQSRIRCGFLLVIGGVLAFSSVFLLSRLPYLPGRIELGLVGGIRHHLLWVGISAFCIFAPICLVLGAVLPLCVSAVRASDTTIEEGKLAGFLYAANSFGAVFGAFTGATVFLTFLGIQWSIILLSSLLTGVGVILVLRRPRIQLSLIGGVATVGVLLVLGAFLGRPDLRALGGGGYLYFDSFAEGSARADQDLLYYRDGAGATVSVFRSDGDTFFAIDGKVDGSTSVDRNTEAFIADLPMSLHPDPQSVLVVGLGTGITAATALGYPEMQSLHCIEILPEVVEAQAFFQDVTGVLQEDSRFRLTIGDGRAEILHGAGTYDIIINEPSNPWMGGTARLFTKEYLAACERKLNRGGIILHWVQGYDLNIDTIRLVVRTFHSVFPMSQIWRVGYGSGDFVLLGWKDQAVSWSLDRLLRASENPGWYTYGSGVKRTSVLEFLSRGIMSSDAVGRFSGAGELITDDLSQLEFIAPIDLYESNEVELFDALRQYSDGMTADLFLNDGSPAPSLYRALAQNAAHWRMFTQLLADFSAKRETFQEGLWEYARRSDEYPAEANAVIASLVMRVAGALSESGNTDASDQMMALATHLTQGNRGER